MQLNKLWLPIVLLLCGALFAADYHDGQLWLEVNLTSEPQLSIKPVGGQLVVSESDGLISRTYSSAIKVSVVNPDATLYYGILDRKESGTSTEPDSLAVPREVFVWEQDKLKIKRELLHFLPQSFSDKPSADAYATAHNIPLSKVMEVHVINSTLKIEDKQGVSYLETPLRISSSGEIFINGSSLGYSGEFILKTVNRQLVINHYLSLETYLAGVVQNEIGNNSPVEAMKAQAVAARTHALSLLVNNRHKSDGYDLCSGTHCQVYKGKYLQNSIVLETVNDCAGEALFVDGIIADATYHSSCGGKTDASSAIWKGKPIAHLNGVTCIPEVDSLDLSCESDARKWIDTKTETAGMSSWERGALAWEKTISAKELASNAGLAYINRIEITRRGRSGRILNLKLIGDQTITLDNEYKIRQVFGNLYSSFFYIDGTYRMVDGNVQITPKSNIHMMGKGAGHGVGMCQVGALRLARFGLSYREILAHYYPGTAISRDWMNE